MYLHAVDEQKSAEADDYSCSHAVSVTAEIVAVHEQQSSRGYEAYGHWAQPGEYTFDDVAVAVASYVVARVENEQKRRHNHSQSADDRAEDAPER